MKDILSEILTDRKKQLAAGKKRVSLSEIEERAKRRPAPRDFFRAVHRPGKISVIAEMKRKSPSAGLIRDPYNVRDVARAYEKAGVAALSVLTEPEKFGGNIEDIDAAFSAASLPIMRKDFLFDPYQIIEACAHGASAVILIADMLGKSQLQELVSVAKAYSLTALVEVFTPASVGVALVSGTGLIGINTRNLRTLEMNPTNVFDLSQRIPRGFAVVAESGIKSTDDIAALKSLEVSAVLVGESLLKQWDLEQAAKVLVQAGE